VLVVGHRRVRGNSDSDSGGDGGGEERNEKRVKTKQVQPNEMPSKLSHGSSYAVANYSKHH